MKSPGIFLEMSRKFPGAGLAESRFSQKNMLIAKHTKITKGNENNMKMLFFFQVSLGFPKLLLVLLAFRRCFLYFYWFCFFCQSNHHKPWSGPPWTGLMLKTLLEHLLVRSNAKNPGVSTLEILSGKLTENQREISRFKKLQKPCYVFAMFCYIFVCFAMFL